MPRLPKTWLIAGAFLWSTASIAEPLNVADLQGSWKLIAPSSTDEKALPRFTIEGQAIQGFDGCNEFSGRLDQPGSIGSTRRGCPEHALRLPLDMSDPMPRLLSGNIENDTLTLPADARFSRASFKKTP
jgi:heat shock protein HslJ